MQNIEEMRKSFISLGLCHMLNSVGYSPQMINLRRRLYRKCESIGNHAPYLPFPPKLVGSKAEGGSHLMESDFDFLYFQECVVCIEASILKYTESIANFNSVYTMVPCLYHPGHFKLLLIREGLPSDITELLHTCLNPSDSGHWLSSKEFLKQVKNVMSGADTTAGPAVCIKNREKLVDNDNTITFRCICPSILGNWIQRNRKYNWPPSEVIEKISEMKGNLVATGIKGCYEEEIEWRLCFNEIEVLIVDNWNEIENKLYILLKMIKKDFLELGHVITSYIMKNIVFWLSESYPQTDFRPDNLFPWVIKALRLLKRAVKEFHLPYYMIPERNLIAEKLPKHRRKDVIKLINNAIKLGPQLLWHCKKIEMAMTMSLPELQLYQQKIDELEWLWLLRSEDKMLKCNCLGLTASEWEMTDYRIALQTRMEDLVFGPWPQVVQQQLSECSTYRDMLKLILK